MKRALIVLVTLATTAATWQALASWRDKRRYSPPGKLIDIGGRRLHILCTGQGLPPVVLEAGSAGDSSTWALVQPEVARFAQVCSYDRAGYGWSDDGIPPRSKTRIANELHALLREAGVPPPFVLVGHSFGGELVRVFAGRYPHETAGLVLVATGHDDWDRRMPPGWVARVQANNRAFIRRLRLLRWLVPFGVLRLWPAHPYLKYARDHLPRDVANAEFALLMRGRPFAAVVDEDSAATVGGTPARYGARPLIVLSDRWMLPDDAPREEVEAARIWGAMDCELAARSTHGKRIVVDGTRHMIPLERPDAVAAAIRAVIEELRAGTTR